MYSRESGWSIWIQVISALFPTDRGWLCGTWILAQNGDVIFDNRRGGHDGTISNSKSQVYASEHVSAEIPYFGFAHKDGKVYRKINMPSTATIILPMEICPCLQGMQWMTFFWSSQQKMGRQKWRYWHIIILLGIISVHTVTLRSVGWKEAFVCSRYRWMAWQPVSGRCTGIHLTDGEIQWNEI